MLDKKESIWASKYYWDYIYQRVRKMLAAFPYHEWYLHSL